MKEIIHRNREMAKIACEQYIKELMDIQSKFGVWEENEDSCSNAYTYTKFYTESGDVKIHCHFD
jgi:hypothetical protein